MAHISAPKRTILSPDADYDELVVEHSYVKSDPADSLSSVYLVYELAQLRPGEDHYTHFYKAARLSVASHPPVSTPSPEDLSLRGSLLSALCTPQVLLAQVTTRIDDKPHVFLIAQGTGYSVEEAVSAADSAYKVICTALPVSLDPPSTDLSSQLLRALSSFELTFALSGVPDPQVSVPEHALTSLPGDFLAISIVVPLKSDDLSGAYRHTLHQLSLHGPVSTSDLDAKATSRRALARSRRYSVQTALEATLDHYLEGVRHGAYLYQYFVLTPTLTTSPTAFSSLSSSSLSIHHDFDSDERMRLRIHAGALTSYRRPERDPNAVSPFVYSTYVTAPELASLVYVPTASPSTQS